MFYPSQDAGIKANELEANAYTLFLIFILLVLGTNKDFDERLSYVSNVIKSSHSAIRMMRAGMSEFHASVLNEKK